MLIIIIIIVIVTIYCENNFVIIIYRSSHHIHSIFPLTEKPHVCYHCHYDTNMDKDKQICNKTLKQCASGENGCADYHISNGANLKGVHGKGCAFAKSKTALCKNETKMCEDLKKTYHLDLSSECDLVCCTALTDCMHSKGYSVVQAANSAIILLFAPFVLVSSFV